MQQTYSKDDFTKLKSSLNFEDEIVFKIIIIGNASVGKTSLKNMATTEVFSNEVNPTIGFELSTLLYSLKDGPHIRLQLWDTCSQETYRCLIKNFYKSSNLAIIAYAVNNHSSFQDVPNWINEVKLNCNPDICIFLVECKIDLEENRQVSQEEIDNLCKIHEIDHFIKTSSKRGENTELLFLEIAAELFNSYKNTSILPGDKVINIL